MSIFRQLPKDLVDEEIICHFPARHLKAFRCTCKTWNLLFNNPRFVTKHSDKAAKEVKAIMLTKEGRICAVSVNLDGIVPSVEVKSELSLIDPLSNNPGAQFDIFHVFHCDGLLLCISEDISRIVVWNPCTGQTRWVKPSGIKTPSYVLGYYYQDGKSSSRTHKVLSFCILTKTSEIYDFSSDSWRVLNRDIIPGWNFTDYGVSLKGKTYWLATDETKTLPGIYLLSFDFSSERASVLVPLPYQCSTYEILTFSAVGEEKIAVLLLPDYTSKIEIWVTNTIDETSPLSWSKVLAFDVSTDHFISSDSTFLLDEEKKLALCCNRWVDKDDIMDMNKIYSVGEDNKTLTEVYSGFVSIESAMPVILNYVPSLVQIEPLGGNKRKRDD